MCAESGDGSSSQLSMLCLDPLKIQTLFEGLDQSPSPRSPTTGTGGQGFGLSQAERRAVELRAMQVAQALYEGTGWEVIDKSSSQPFDLLATKGVPAAPKLTTRADCALTSVCRVAVVVNRRSAQTAETDQFRIGGNSIACTSSLSG